MYHRLCYVDLCSMYVESMYPADMQYVATCTLQHCTFENTEYLRRQIATNCMYVLNTTCNIHIHVEIPSYVLSYFRKYFRTFESTKVRRYHAQYGAEVCRYKLFIATVSCDRSRIELPFPTEKLLSRKGHIPGARAPHDRGKCGIRLKNLVWRDIHRQTAKKLRIWQIMNCSHEMYYCTCTTTRTAKILLIDSQNPYFMQIYYYFAECIYLSTRRRRRKIQSTTTLSTQSICKCV